MVSVFVNHDNLSQAVRALRKITRRECYRNKPRYYEKPSEKRIRKRVEAQRRRRKLENKRLAERL